MGRNVVVPYDTNKIVLSDLTEREMFIISRRVGKHLGHNRQYSLEELGYALGISKEYVRKIETIALCKMKHPYIIKKLGMNKVKKIANTKRKKFI